MLVFFGTSPRSAKFLELAIQNGLKVDLVVSDPPKPFGKKQILTENLTISLAKKFSLPFVSNLSDLRDLSNLSLGLILDYNKIIPNEIINLFDKGIINIHFSKLPQYRGPAPVQYTILNGDRQAWITYFLINENVDAGPIIGQTSLPLDLTETTKDLYQKLIAKAASETSKIICGRISKWKLSPQIDKPSYTQKLTTENCQIDLSKPAEQIERLIRAAHPEPGAWTSVEIPASPAGGRSQSAEIKKVLRLKILSAHLDQGKLVLDMVQLEGKNPVTWKQFTEGYPEAEISRNETDLSRGKNSVLI